MKLVHLTENQKEKIKNLQPDTVLSVFHGTDLETAWDFSVNGIDGRKRHPRKYPHWSNDEIVSRGLFITTNFRTATSFGSVILKFKVLGKHLVHEFPHPDHMRVMDKQLKSEYPNSFRPSVSDNLLQQGSEPQALFRGVVSPRAIERIYTVNYNAEGEYNQGLLGKYQASFTRDQFIKWNETHFKNKYEKPYTEPQERITLDDLVDRVIAKYGKFKDSIDRDTVLRVIKDAVANAETYNQQIHGLMNFPGGKALSYTVAKRLLPQVLDYFNIPMAPNKHEKIRPIR